MPFVRPFLSQFPFCGPSFCGVSTLKAQAALGIRTNLPAGAPQYSEAFKPPEDFAYANWLVGSQTIKEELGEDRQLQKHKLAGWLKDRYDWIGILEEPQISLHVLQRRFPRYFGNMI